YEIARYLAAFDTRFPRSLPGRALPAPVVSVAIIALLGVSYAWPVSDIWIALVDLGLPHWVAWLLDPSLSSPVFLATCVFAGFLLRLPGAMVVAAGAFGSAAIFVDGFGEEIPLQNVILPFVLGWYGQLWGAHVRGATPFRLPSFWIRYGVLLAALVAGLAALHPRLAAAIGGPLWLGLMLGSWALLRPGGAAARMGLVAEGKQLQVLNFCLLVAVVLGFGNAVTGFYSQAMTALFLTARGGDVSDLFDAPVVAFFVVAAALGGLLFALHAFLGAVVEARAAIAKIARRTHLRIAAPGSELAALLGLARPDEGTGLRAVRALGAGALLSPAALALALLWAATGLGPSLADWQTARENCAARSSFAVIGAEDGPAPVPSPSEPAPRFGPWLTLPC
ncbi:MAG: hypothetical protein AAGH73_10330, partial [Pseudomonadota bacterium]